MDKLIVIGIILLICVLLLLPDIIYAIKHRNEHEDFYDDEDTYVG